MKKLLLLCLTLNLLSCNDSGSNDNVNPPIDSIKDYPDPPPKAKIKDTSSTPIALQVYSNKRFKDVTVKKSGENEYTIEGKGQIFEASFNYVTSASCSIFFNNSVSATRSVCVVFSFGEQEHM